MSELIPDVVGDVQIPTGRNAPKSIDNKSSDADILGYYMPRAIEHASQSLVNQLLNMEDTDPTMLNIRTQMSRGVKGKRTLEYKRPQNSNSILMQVYGTEQAGAKSCANCLKGNGPYTSCKVLPGHTSCANCTYNSGASNCSFVPGGTKRASSELSTPVKKKAMFKATRLEHDFLVLIRGVKPKHVRRISNALVSVADKLEKNGYRPDEIIDVPAHSDSESELSSAGEE